MVPEPFKANKLDPVTSINACFASLDEALDSFSRKLGVFVSFWDKVRLLHELSLPEHLS